jgi:hypothetical protein
MSFPLRSRVLAFLALAAIATSAHAATVPFVTQGGNGASGTRSDLWHTYIPAASTITCHVQLSSPNAGGGAGSNVKRSGSIVVGCYVNLPGPGSISDSYTVTGQPSGVYEISHGFGGPPNSVNAYMQTTFSW